MSTPYEVLGKRCVWCKNKIPADARWGDECPVCNHVIRLRDIFMIKGKANGRCREESILAEVAVS